MQHSRDEPTAEEMRSMDNANRDCLNARISKVKQLLTDNKSMKCPRCNGIGMIDEYWKNYGLKTIDDTINYVTDIRYKNICTLCYGAKIIQQETLATHLKNLKKQYKENFNYPRR